MKIAIAQCRSDMAEKYLIKATKEKCDIILFPELVTCDLDYTAKIIVGHGYEEEKGLIFKRKYNTYELTNSYNYLKYRKQNLFPGYDDGRTPGEKLPHCYLNIRNKTYVCICYDIRFDKVFGKMESPDLIIIPADFPVERIEDWKGLLRQRACETGAWVIGVNTPGGGCSAIIAPDGNTHLEAYSSEGLLMKELNIW